MEATRTGVEGYPTKAFSSITPLSNQVDCYLKKKKKNTQLKSILLVGSKDHAQLTLITVVTTTTLIWIIKKPENSF